jgi:RNA polymerase primary sigma factor
MDIKAVDDVSTKVADGELEAEVKEDRDEAVQVASAADSISELSDPVRLYLKEMGNFPILSREQEVEIPKRIEAGENQVEEEVLRSPITLDFVITIHLTNLNYSDGRGHHFDEEEAERSELPVALARCEVGISI